MTEEERVGYLANIFYMVRVDGDVKRVEEKVFEKIGKDIGAGYYEMSKAEEQSKAEGFKIKIPVRLSDRIRMIEDMLVIAYSDEQLHGLERKLLSGYARELSLPREQLDRITKESKSRLKEMKAGIY